MNRQCQLSNVARDYLETYQCILENMIKGMTCANLTDSISSNFISQMIPHHQAAIEMCQNLLRFTTNVPLQNIAQNIICEQTRSIENMQEIACGCEQCTNCRQDLCQYQERANCIMNTMFRDMKCVNGTNQINADFIRQMIPHHRGAIEMCQNALCYNICPQLTPILKSIICSQERGIAQMERLLKCMNCN